MPSEVLAPGVPSSFQPTLLDNGLTVFVQEAHQAPLASVWCWYKVGSKDERSGLTGVAHWVEHMNFKGTTNIPRDQVKGIIEQFGGYWNGYTWIDQTTYTETATRDALDRMLFIESERMSNCLYDPADCESERTVIISELQGGENDPDQLLDQELTATAFRAHPYRHPTIGWLGDLQTMSRDDLYAYYRRFYLPNNATLVIVGDVDRKDAMRQVVQRFGSIPAGQVAAIPHTREPEQLGERRVTVARQGTTAYLKVGYHAPAVSDPAFFPLLLLEGWNLHAGSVRTLLHRQPRTTELLLLCAHTAGGVALLLTFLSPLKALIFLLVQQSTFGLYLGATFAPNHKGMPILDAGSEHPDFLRRQVLTSRNITGGRLTALGLGSLNFQIEHHLFPSMPSANLRRCRPLVRRFCAEHAVAYTETGLFDSYRRVLRYLGNIRPDGPGTPMVTGSLSRRGL